jgi:hypothetical protein
MLWKQKLMNAIENSMGKVHDLCMNDYKGNVDNVFEFWRFLRLPEQKILEQADNGDIILCEGKKSGMFAGKASIECVCLLVRLIDDADGE